MPVPDSTLAHYRDQQHLTARAMAAARLQWARFGYGDFDDTWRAIGPRLLAILATAQRAASFAGAAYVAAAVRELELGQTLAADVVPQSLVGVASDGRPLQTLLFSPVVTARTALGAGVGLEQALLSGRDSLDEIIRTQVADAARIASGLAIVARTDVTGWVRMLNPPSCGRCAVLAGKFFRWNQGFERHPRCDCRHIPSTEAVAGDLTLDPRKAVEAGQVTGLSKADTKAIDDGADVGQVINARRGMYTASAYGQRLAATREGTTKRGAASHSLAAAGGSYTRTPRLMPEEIYRQAGDDRILAIHLLRRFGYLRAS